jgi:CDP-glucose 4,6-dehydratase
LILAQALYMQGSSFASGCNFGPVDADNRAVKDVVNLLISTWGETACWEIEGAEHPHEANLLKLDCSKARMQLGWTPKWDLGVATQKIVQWQKAFQAKENMQKVSLAQINEYQTN